MFFSIITPVYNRREPVVACIQSVLGQTFSDWEMILVNDGSSDDSASVIRGFSSVSLIDYAENRGVNYARNRGMEKASGEWLLFLDSDDWLTSPESLSLVRETILAHPGFSHYLFRVSDRGSSSGVVEYSYADWITGVATGDFVHVVRPSSFADMPFFEDFRIYEVLNWLRVMRREGKQLYIPETITTRDRGRADSVTRETRMQSRAARENRFRFLERMLSLYAADFAAFGMQARLDADVRTAVLLGISLRETARVAALIDTYAPRSPLRRLNTPLLSGMLTRVIEMKSNYNHRKA